MDAVLFALEKIAPELPVTALWLPVLMLCFLLAAAAVDAFTARVPDAIILSGFVIATGAVGFLKDWQLSSERLAMGLGAAFFLSLLNHLWYKGFKKDGFGMGDAKWTGLAVTSFGIMPSIISWIVGSWLAVLWIVGARLIGKKVAHVHFAPFLFLGLLAGIYATFWLNLFV